MALAVLWPSGVARGPQPDPQPVAAAPDDSEVKSFIVSWMELAAQGVDDLEANRLAHIEIFGEDPYGESVTSSCDYYVVTTHYCDGLTRRTVRSLVGTVCIEQAFPGLCSLPACPAGQKRFYKLSTASSGCSDEVPADTCVWVTVTGPYTATSTVCDMLEGCGRWPGLGCSSPSALVAVAGAHSHPIGCPDCD